MCTMKPKTISSLPGQSSLHVQESTTTQACGGADTEAGVLRLVYKQRKMHAAHKTVFVNMSEDFDRDDLQFWQCYFNDVLTTFLDLECGSCMLSMEGQKALGFN